MKHIIIILLFFHAICRISYSQTSDSDHYVKDKYVAKVKIISCSEIKTGYIKSLDDSSLVLSEHSDPQNRKDLTIDVSLIDKIAFRKNGQPGIGECTLYGFLIGTGLGVGIGLISGDDANARNHDLSSLFAFTKEAKALIGGTLLGTAGGLIGLAIGLASHGSPKISIPIHGKLSNYKNSKYKLEKYTY